MIRVVRDKLREEVFFAVATVIALLSSFFVHPRFEAIDWHVIGSLFALMGVALVFEKYKLLDAIAKLILSRVDTAFKLACSLILITSLLAMFLTNDVALITMVPLTFIICNRGDLPPLYFIISETLVANMASSLTPFGNPQNLFLYSKFGSTAIQFMLITGPFVAMGILLTLGYLKLHVGGNIKPLHIRVDFKLNLRVSYFIVLFIATILGVLRFLPLMPILVTVTLFLAVLEPRLLLKIDYFLLGTFLSAFIAIDNLTHLPLIVDIIAPCLETGKRVFLSSIFLSQIISNVPTAVLLSGFTTQLKPLLLGVSIGGMGTMIASFANLISYKYYCKFELGSVYLREFTKVNMVYLIIFVLGYLWLL